MRALLIERCRDRVFHVQTGVARDGTLCDLAERCAIVDTYQTISEHRLMPSRTP